jgi:hypothetical protein
MKMVLCARRSVWLLGFAFVACRYGYEELGSDPSRAAVSGAAGKPAPDGTAGASSQGATPGLGGEAMQVGGESTQIGDAGAPSGGTGSQSGGSGGQSAGAGQGGSAGAAGNADCANAVALTSNAAPSVAPALDCAYPGALLCDDFEDGQEPYWTVVANAPAQASLETCLVHGGSHALWAHPASAASGVQLQEQLSPTVGSGGLFVRTFLYLPSSTPLPIWSVIYEVWDSPTSWNNKISIDLQADGTVTLNNWAGAGQQKTSLTSSTALIPRDQWTCMELEIGVDKVSGSTRLYLDDTQVITSTGNIRTRGTRAFSTVSMGAVTGDNALDLYQDDFVVATQRIGCN